MNHKLIEKATTFATEAHKNQVRRLEGGPYSQHPIRVAKLVTTIEGWTEIHVAAALLHDVVEDTPITIETIEQEFGMFVGELVFELTDTLRQPGENRAKHKARELELWPNKSTWAQNIKCCDVIDNSESIIRLDPDFAVVYCKEVMRMLQVFDKADKNILERAIKSITYP